MSDKSEKLVRFDVLSPDWRDRTVVRWANRRWTERCRPEATKETTVSATLRPWRIRDESKHRAWSKRLGWIRQTMWVYWLILTWFLKTIHPSYRTYYRFTHFLIIKLVFTLIFQNIMQINEKILRKTWSFFRESRFFRDMNSYGELVLRKRDSYRKKYNHFHQALIVLGFDWK